MAANNDRWIALVGAIAVHIVLFAVLAYGVSSHREPPARVAMKPVIQASAVSEQKVMEPYRERLAAEAAEKRRIAEEKRKAVEAKRRAEEARKKAEAERKRKAAEKRRQEALKKKQAAEKARLAALEKQRKIEAERKAAEEAKKKAEAERKRREAEEQAKREAALKKQLEAEAKRLEQEQQQYRSARLSRLQDQYVADITNKVQRNWLRPPDSHGTLCSVVIRQIPGGEIIGVQVTDCDGDVAFKRSVEAAVRKASPLPQPPEKELFQREIEFVFRPLR